jgi:hypothetical protein
MKRALLRQHARARGGLGAVVALGVMTFSSCSPREHKYPERPSLLEPAAAPGGDVGAAEWRYHPRRPSHLERSYPLPDGRGLLVGAAGERWLADGKRHDARPASMLAPETLVGALSTQRAPWVFVGRSGTTYDADTPLGPFLSSSAPLVEMAKVDAGARHVLGVSRDGELWLSADAGLGWHPVGPAGARFEDVLVAPPHALALEVPERLWASEDEGQSWQPLDRAPFGARALTRNDASGPVVVSVLGAMAIGFGPSVTFSPLNRALAPAEPALDFRPVQGPSARAVAQGRAFDSGGRYVELLLGAKAEMIAGAWRGDLERRPAPLFNACADARVAGFEDFVYVACTRERSGPARQLEFFRSGDGGVTFEREPYAARGDPELLRLAVGRDGVLLASGLCAPTESVAGCRPRGIFRRETSEGDAGGGPVLTEMAAPALEEHARGLVFSSDGRVAYAVGTRTKSDALFAFISTDLARGFSARPVSTPDEADARGPTEVLSLTASNEGQLSLVLAQSSGAQRLVVLDAGARTLSINPPPVDAAVIGAYGNRAIAVSPDNVWESLNGGAEWDDLGRLPRSICAANSGRCSIRVHCEAAGCTLGDSLSRVGWRGHQEPSALLLPPAAPRLGGDAQRSLGPALSCDLSSSEWSELRGVDRLPDAGQAALGKAAWFALATDDATAAAGLYIAETSRLTLDRSSKVRYSELLAPTSRAADVAYQATLQVEGAAALRYTYPRSGTAETSIQNVEVAWDNLFEGVHRRALLADAGALRPGDYVKSDGVARRAQPDLVSIASGGIFLRMHRQPQYEQETYFLDGSSVETLPALRWPQAPPKDLNLEMARLGGDSVHLAFVDQGATVVRARRVGPGWQFDAVSIGYHDPSSFSIEQHRDIAYARGATAIHLTTRRPGGTTEGRLFPLRADGPVLGAPIAMPTQRDLGDDLSVCTAQQRADTPRVVAPYHPGRRRPLVVHDAVEPVRVFLSDAAVLHGTPEHACALAFDADLVKGAGGSANPRERALLSLEGPSWLFRFATDTSRREARVEYRAMNCRPDSGVELPPEIYDLPGTNRAD